MAEKLKEICSFFVENFDLNQKSLLVSLAAIIFNPTAWNIVARNGTTPRIQ
jgi:phosphatidylethanolamine N-methyltransferase